MAYRFYNELYLDLCKDLASLASTVGIDEDELKRYFVPEGNTSAESILFRLASSLQNGGSMGKTIKFNIRDENGEYRNREIIGEVLFDFNAEKAAIAYSENWRQIYTAMKAAGIVDNGSGENRETYWQQYCHGLFDGIVYLTKHDGVTKIRTLVSKSSCSHVSDEMIEAIISISEKSKKSKPATKIHGMGFPLACDWLKECGCTWLAKPDRHTKDVVMYLMRKDKANNVDKLLKKDVEKVVAMYVFDWAVDLKTSHTDDDATAYKIDKTIWLLCTGEFYLHGRKPGKDAILRRIDLL